VTQIASLTALRDVITSDRVVSTSPENGHVTGLESHGYPEHATLRQIVDRTGRFLAGRGKL